MRKHHVVLVCWAAAGASLGLFPGAAAGQRFNAPPGNSGIQEYVELVPDGSGSKPTNPIANELANPPALGGAGLRALAATGPDGDAAAKLAAATAPDRVGGGAPEGDGDSLASAVVDRVGSGSMGFALPLLLALGLLAAIAYFLRGRLQA